MLHFMLEIQILREQKDRVLTGLKKRGFSDERLASVDQALVLDDRRKELQTQLDGLLNERNKLSDEIGRLFKSGQAAEANQLKTKVQDLKTDIDNLENLLIQARTDLDQALVALPNIPHSTVPE